MGLVSDYTGIPLRHLSTLCVLHVYDEFVIFFKMIFWHFNLLLKVNPRVEHNTPFLLLTTCVPTCFGDLASPDLNYSTVLSPV